MRHRRSDSVVEQLALCLGCTNFLSDSRTNSLTLSLGGGPRSNPASGSLEARSAWLGDHGQRC